MGYQFIVCCTDSIRQFAISSLIIFYSECERVPLNFIVYFTDSVRQFEISSLIDIFQSVQRLICVCRVPIGILCLSFALNVGNTEVKLQNDNILILQKVTAIVEFF